jgi:ferric-dicitrate binding protein FerR (iron transport regulator)
MGENIHIQEIMLRYLNGEQTPEESRQLEQWITDNPSNAEEFDLIKKIWADTSSAALIPVDTHLAWQHVKAKIMGRETKVVKMFPWKRAMAIAASLLLVISVAYFLLKPKEIEWRETFAQKANLEIKLEDGTKIFQSGGIIHTENFGKEIRQVKLEGEAFFDVVHNAQNPFSVITANSLIKDIGTLFLVQSTGIIEQVTVMEGEVSYTTKRETQPAILLKAGESAVIIKEKVQRKNVDTSNLISWSTRILTFNNSFDHCCQRFKKLLQYRNRNCRQPWYS